ncbi:interleukin-15 isoform 2-T2 [Mantella aurantiaca]
MNAAATAKICYTIPGWCIGIQRKWQQIGEDLNRVYEILEKSKYWNYHTGLKLYTASASNVDTCRNSILHCYVQELKTVVEEVNLIGDEDAAQRITHKIDDIVINGDLLDFMQNGSCKKCEEYEEKPIEEFMEDFRTLTQKIQNLT